MSINKILLENNQAHLYMYSLQEVLCYNAIKLIVVTKMIELKIFTVWLFTVC